MTGAGAAWALIGYFAALLVLAWGSICLVAALLQRPWRALSWRIRQRRYWKRHPAGPLPEWAKERQR